jgi:hypothetical protein
MYRFSYLIFLLGALTVTGCGGGGGVEQSPSPTTSSRVDSAGELSSAQAGSSFSGNLFLSIRATNSSGIGAVALRFIDNGPTLNLCSGQSCGGTLFSETVSGINPGEFEAVPGPISVTLLVTDTQQQTEAVSTLEVEWLPQTINDVQAVRSANGESIEVSWTLNPQLLRYNIYIASQTGVNQRTFQALPNGQALLAVNSGPQIFSNLQPNLDYFVLLAGIDGSGESTNLNEIALPANTGAPNNNPIANADMATLDEDNTLLIDVLANDTDPDGDALTITGATTIIGAATIQANQIFYEPPLNFNGNTTVNYAISDNNGGTADGQITLQVNAINDAPEATNDFVSTLINTPINIDVLANDMDIDGDALTVNSTTGGQGTTVIEADDTITYTPAVGFIGTDTFDYIVDDGNGGTSTAVASVDVGATSRQPIANNDNYIVLSSQTLTVNVAQGLLVNDADPDGDTITVNVTPVRDVANGALALATDGSFTYQPNAGFAGNDSFEYQITDGNGQVQSATANLDVRAIPADLGGDSTSISGAFLYIGQGEATVGTGVGTGLYRTGDCLQDANTRCVTQGNYIESATSGNNPNQIGSYAFVQTYAGNGDSPVVAQSTTPGGNEVSFTNLGGSLFELFLFPDSGGVFRAPFPDNEVFANSLFFGAFISANQNCTGLPVGLPCNIGQVGLVDDAQLAAPLDRLNFSQTGAALVDSDNDSPLAMPDTFTVTRDTTLTVNAPGVLQNDSDPDITVVGDDLQVLSQFSPGIGALTAVGFDEYRQRIYTTNNSGNAIAINNRLSAIVGTIPVPGGLTNHIDIEIASEALQLAGTLIPQGSVIVINGENGTAEVFALEPDNGTVLAQLNTNVGNGDVVGGAYNPRTQSLFLLQETQANTGDPIISEVDINTGATLNQFTGVFTALDFDVGLGDIEVNNETGSLYVVSDIEINILEQNSDGGLVRLIGLPNGVIGASGMAVSQAGERIWVSSNTGNVFELSFVNQGVLPQLQARLVVTTENGTLVTGRDGSFIYTPNAGFVGSDIFTYEIVDQNGKNSLNNVRITVTN